MKIKLAVLAAAIALVAGLGPATAGEEFDTLVSLSPHELSLEEMAEIRGAVFIVSGNPNNVGVSGGFPIPDNVCTKLTCNFDDDKIILMNDGTLTLAQTDCGLNGGCFDPRGLIQN